MLLQACLAIKRSIAGDITGAHSVKAFTLVLIYLFIGRNDDNWKR